MKMFSNKNFLKISYVIGGVYDVLLGIGVLFFRNFLLTFIHESIPNVAQISDALGLFLIAYGYLLLDESQKSDPRINIGLTSALVRIIFFLSVVYYAVFYTVELLYIILASTDLLTGLLILYGIYTFKKREKL